MQFVCASKNKKINNIYSKGVRLSKANHAVETQITQKINTILQEIIKKYIIANFVLRWQQVSSFLPNTCAYTCRAHTYNMYLNRYRISKAKNKCNVVHEKFFNFRHPLTMKNVLCTDSIHSLCEANVGGG
jgi:hypothetical protein